MLYILRPRYPFKIFYGVVMLIAILVIYLRKIAWVWNKRLCHQPMNNWHVPLGTNTEHDLDVMVFVLPD